MKLTKSMKNKLTAVLATGVLMTSMVGCSSTTKEAELTDLTITHVTSPLNVPSIIQKTNNVFADEFKANGKDVTINYAEITSGADQTQALASGDVDVLYAVGGPSVISAAANGADINSRFAHHPQELLVLLIILTQCRNLTSFLFHLLLCTQGQTRSYQAKGSPHQADQTSLRN